LLISLGTLGTLGTTLLSLAFNVPEMFYVLGTLGTLMDINRILNIAFDEPKIIKDLNVTSTVKFKTTTPANDIDLDVFLKSCCRGLSTTPEEVKSKLLSQENEQQIVDGDYSQEQLSGFIKMWLKRGKQHVSGKLLHNENNTIELYLEQSKEDCRIQCEYCRFISGSSCTKKQPNLRNTAYGSPIASKWHRCKGYEYSGVYQPIEAPQPDVCKLPEHYHQHDKSWISKQLSTLDRAQQPAILLQYSELFQERGRQRANLHLLELNETTRITVH